MAEVYFENIDKVIISHLNKAQFEVKIAVAWITDSSILNAIYNCLIRNVNVTIIFYDDKINSKDKFENLFRNGALIYYTKKLMHNKFCIIDSTITINGSYNWTKAAKGNHENIQINHSPNIAEQFLSEYNKILSKANNINKYFASNEEDFMKFVEEIGFPISYPLYYKQELNKELKNLFKRIRDIDINYLYIYISDYSHYLDFQKAIYKYFQKANEISNLSLELTLASKYNINAWIENYGIDKIERFEYDSFYIIDIIQEINSDFHLSDSEYHFEKNKFSTDKFIYSKEQNFIILGIEKEEITASFSQNKPADLNSLLTIKITNSNSNIVFENICSLMDTNIFYQNNYIIIETQLYLHFDIGTIYKNSFQFKKLFFLKYPQIEIDKDLTENDRNTKVKIFEQEQNLYKQNLMKLEQENHKKKFQNDDKQCYIATMVYGDIDHYKVEILRKFRDKYLKKQLIGKFFIKFYYLISPTIVKYFNNKYFISFSKILIESLLKKIKTLH